MRNIILCAALVLASFGLNAQNHGEDQWGSWLLYFGTNRISQDLSIHSELQYNHYKFLSNFNQFWAIAALNYHINDQASASFGYGYFLNDPTFLDGVKVKDIDENRIFEQFTLSSKFKNLKLQHRYRLEHRFLNTSFGTPTRHRFRYRLQLTHPISGRWFFNVFDEVFLNFSETIFDQNRWFTALGFSVNENIKLQAGYLKLHFTGLDYDRIQLVLNVNTDLRKKE